MITKPTTTRHGGAKLRLLEATESLFAETNTDTVSIRQITRAAGANVAAVNYHFGSRDGLVSAVLDRHFEEINSERLFRLELALQQTSPSPVEGILRAFSGPWLEDVFRSEHNTRLFGALAAKILEGGNESGHRTYRPGETPVAISFVRALQRQFPTEIYEQLEDRFTAATRELFRMTFTEVERCMREGFEPRIEKITDAYLKAGVTILSEDLLPLAEAG